MRTSILTSLLIVLLCVTHINCSGQECSASKEFITDIDSDCVDDTGDNCVGTYNPDQFDGDEDGVGTACDSSDTDDTTSGVTLIKETEIDLFGHYPLVSAEEAESSSYYVTETNCDIAEMVSHPDSINDGYITFTQNNFNCSVIYFNGEESVYCKDEKGCFGLYEMD